MAKKQKLKRIRTPIGQRFDSRLHLPITLLFWTATGLGAWLLHESRPVTQEFLGLVRNPEVEVASAIDGRLVPNRLDLAERALRQEIAV